MKYISVDTANKMLSLIRPITEDIVQTWQAATEKTQWLKDNTDSDDLDMEGHREFWNEMDEFGKRLGENLDEIEELGCIVEDYKIGVIDFPSSLDGEDIMLCWKLGEEEVGHYHRPGEGFKDRILLKEILE